ncbi:hypothetical protein N9U94_05240 [Acidimicrobiaceae bacterium]|nr:hypothetical protein [Acidimicrobiaceae bacterium]MDA9712592.1 hypothetical protein [Acidimicrobiaceae bacterium]
MIENSKKLIGFILFLLILSACSSDDSSGPTLVEISSDEEDVDYEEEDDDEEENDEEENDDMEITEFIPPELPDLPDPALSSTKWNQVNGPFGGTITSIFKSSDGYWVTTTDNSGLSDSNLYLVDSKTFIWELKKTISGNMGGVVVNVSNSNQIAFYTEATSNSDSGVFVSKDGGKTWEEAKIDGSQYSAIAIGSQNTSTLYVAGRHFPNGEDCEDEDDCTPEKNSAIFISNDFGTSWIKSSSIPKGVFEEIELEEGQELEEEDIDKVRVLYVSPSDDDHIFVGTSNLLLKSNDRGSSWESLSDTFHRSDIKGLAIHPNNPNIIYARIGLYTFSDCSDIDNDDSDYEESVSKYCPGIYKSTDGGESWKLLEEVTGDPSEGGVYINEYNDSEIYSVFGRETFVSKDAGISSDVFLDTKEHPIIPDVGVEIITFGESESEVFMAGLQGVYRTYDNGKTWIETNTGFVGSEVVDLVTALDGTMYATTYNLGIFKSTDGGKNWVFASFGIKNWYGMQLATHPEDADTLFTTTNGGVYKSTNAGESWKLIGGSDLCDDEDAGGNCHYHGIVVEKEAPFKVLVGSGGDQYAKEGVGLTGSEDNGESWRNSDDGFVRDVHVSKLVIDPNNNNVFYATTQGETEYTDKVGDGAGVFKSTDRGNNWTQINNGLNSLETNVLAVDPNDSDILYLGTDDDGIYKSINGGENWEKLIPSASFGVGDIIVDPQNSNNVYMGTVDYFRLSESRGVLGDFGVYKSTDGGTTWEELNSGLNHLGVFSLELSEENRILYAGTRAGGVYWINLDG